MRRRRPLREPRAQLDLDEAERTIRTALAQEPIQTDVHPFVLAHGRAFKPVERPADIAPGTRHQPFLNAFALASERPQLRYHEGFTLARGWTDQPNRHAWCVDPSGHAIDPTPGWAEPGGPLRDCYLGVAIPLEFAAPYVAGGKGVLYELTGRMPLLAAALG